jgi:formylmethanofuran dehydrogenase subunit B
MWNDSIDETINSVTCPGCGLSCDDLTITISGDQLISLGSGCKKAHDFYDAAFKSCDPTPLVDGSPASLDQALAECATQLEQSDSPLFAGLATDVNGMRGTLLKVRQGNCPFPLVPHTGQKNHSHFRFLGNFE